MRRLLHAVPTSILVFVFAILVHPVQAQSPHIYDITGDWLITIDYFNNPLEQAVSVYKEGSGLTANYIGDTARLKVSRNGNVTKIVRVDPDGSKTEYEGIFEGKEGKGAVRMYDAEIKDTVISSWKAIKLNTTLPAIAHRIDFIPTTFQRAFSSGTVPVLHIWPNDTIHTESVDAGGMDKKGKKRVLGGNPLTGPFYVETALPGNVLAVTISRLKLNRTWAISSRGIVDRALTNAYTAKHKVSFQSVKWNLDLKTGMATPEKPNEHMKQFSVPVKPMLGCVGVAPGFGSQPIRTGDSGPFGGNMDFNEIIEGATVYLPVFRAGALLYLGDAHALQGDGELTGDALETSMDIEFKVRVIKDTSIHLGTPRVENDQYIMAVGLSGSLDDAFKRATTELADWLEQSYKLIPAEVAQVLGTCIEYQICEVADRNVGVVARVKKARLAQLNK
jgi:amidase